MTEVQVEQQGCRELAFTVFSVGYTPRLTQADYRPARLSSRSRILSVNWRSINCAQDVQPVSGFAFRAAARSVQRSALWVGGGGARFCVPRFGPLPCGHMRELVLDAHLAPSVARMAT